ncbi:ABC transporter, partial [Streptomyces sp. B1866]|nr:ABC transporter [Streptomyces sp. B1866]
PPRGAARSAAGGVRVVRDGDDRLLVYGMACAAVGELAHRHGIAVHRLADEAAGPPPAERPAPGSADTGRAAGRADGHPEADPEAARPSGWGPVLPELPPPGPAWPLRYELRRATSVRTGWLIVAAGLAGSFLLAVLLARTGGAGDLYQLTGWPADLPLPPVAVASGLLGALAFGEEFRYPALAPDRDTVPRCPTLLVAKMAVCGVAAVLLTLAVLALDGAGLLLLFGGESVPTPGDWPPLTANVCALALGCSWAGLLGAGVFRSTAFGLTAVFAVPLAAVPVVERAMSEPSLRSLATLPHRLRAHELDRLPFLLERTASVLLRFVSPPVGQAMVLSLVGLVCAYAIAGRAGRRGRARQ